MTAEFELHEKQRRFFAPAYQYLGELTSSIKGGLRIETDSEPERFYCWHEGMGSFGSAYFKGGLCFDMVINHEGVQRVGILKWNKKADFEVKKIMYFYQPERDLKEVESVAGPEVKQQWDNAAVKVIDEFFDLYKCGKAEVYAPQS